MLYSAYIQCSQSRRICRSNTRDQPHRSPGSLNARQTSNSNAMIYNSRFLNASA